VFSVAPVAEPSPTRSRALLRRSRRPDRPSPPPVNCLLSVEEFQLLLAKSKDPELRNAILVLCMTTLRLRELLVERTASRRAGAVRLRAPHEDRGAQEGSVAARGGSAGEPPCSCGVLRTQKLREPRD